MLPALAHVDCWIFDLDNTLYPAKADLFALIDVKMGEFVQGLLGCDAQVARETQKRYFMEHGTTLSGLMRHHDIEPRAFLDFVHDISM
ncbi:MAG: pyrimidine 5'-nucleotidase, partial [Sphingobium sp.]